MTRIRRVSNAQLLQADARNRSLRSFLTGLGIDVAVAVAMAVMTFFSTNNGWGAVEWAVLSYSFAKSLLQAAAAYVLRWFLDPSGFPTPLPPARTGEPDAE